uniref:hypothetical protein n=1 Tax=Tepidiforma sp. TaxID=2682230 RepID=UPI002ADE4F23
LARFRRRRVQRDVARMIREGVGVSEGRWALGGRAEAGALAGEIAAWAREKMAGMRRPRGIDQVVLALACRDAAGTVVCSGSLGVVKPGLFYEETGERKLREFLEGAAGVVGPGDGEVLAALLRLGEIAYALEGGAAAA